ncbi:MAG: glycosyltransferase [Flavobacteriaceae bacterium]|nr:glycosyltransferase [Flavobacteriaceae bacterium]
MLLTGLFYFFILIVSIQFVYWLLLFGKFAFAQQQRIVEEVVPVSIIIAARNEAENLKELVPLLLTQHHQTFEIIIVNDASTDSTVEVVNSFGKEHLKLITIPAVPNYFGNKKNAITQGIKAAHYEHLLFTDADCRPASSNWVTQMTSLLNKDKAIVLGYGAYKKLPSFVNKLIRYETLVTAIQYFSYSKIGLPYMGVGRNLSYKKDLFLEASGFESHGDIKSGDDDLFINEMATEKNTANCFSKESFTISEPKKTYKSWFHQKRRHISTATYYKPIHQFLLAGFFVSQLLFWVLAIILLAFSLNWQFVILFIAIRCIAQYTVVSRSASKLNEKDLVLVAPVLDIIVVLTQLALFCSNLIQKPKHW